MSYQGSGDKSMPSSGQSSPAPSPAHSQAAPLGTASRAPGMTGTPESRRVQGMAPGAHASSSAGSQQSETRGAAEGMYETAANAVADVTHRAAELADDASDLGARYYREGSRAISNLTGASAMPLLVGVAFGYFVGWMVYGQSGGTAYTASRRPYGGDYEDRFRSAESRSRSQNYYP